jgi:hypothetical protein
MTTAAPKRMRFAALGLSTALSIGVLAPFVATGEASAAVSCTSARASYTAANAQLHKDQAKLKKAKKKLRKAKKAHKAAHVIKHKKRVVKKDKRHVRMDKIRRAHAANAVRTCAGPVKSTPQGTANPLSDLIGQLQTALGGAGAPAQLTDALGQLQSALSSIPVPAGMDPAAFQKALTDSAAQVQAELQAALAQAQSDPTSFTAKTLLDDILNPIITGLKTAGVPTLPDVLQGLEDSLDPILASLGLATLFGNLPTGGGLPFPIPGM